jgi:hypothetical protein
MAQTNVLWLVPIAEDCPTEFQLKLPAGTQIVDLRPRSMMGLANGVSIVTVIDPSVKAKELYSFKAMEIGEEFDAQNWVYVGALNSRRYLWVSKAVVSLAPQPPGSR